MSDLAPEPHGTLGDHDPAGTTPVRQSPVALEALERSAFERDGLREVPQREAGLMITWFLIGLVALVLILIAAYAAMTRPTVDDALTLVPQADDRYQAYRELRSSWFSEIKDLVQLTVVSLLIPLVSTVIGYTLGRNELQKQQG